MGRHDRRDSSRAENLASCVNGTKPPKNRRPTPRPQRLGPIERLSSLKCNVRAAPRQVAKCDFGNLSAERSAFFRQNRPKSASLSPVEGDFGRQAAIRPGNLRQPLETIHGPPSRSALTPAALPALVILPPSCYAQRGRRGRLGQTGGERSAVGSSAASCVHRGAFHTGNRRGTAGPAAADAQRRSAGEPAAGTDLGSLAALRL